MPRHKRGKTTAKTARKARISPRRRRSEPEGREAALAAFVHEIRTPLTGILALAELLDASGLGERERRWVAAIKDSGEHLASLTTLVIDAAKAKTAGLVLCRDVFEPRRLADNLAETMRARAAAKGLMAEVAIADDLPRALGDPVRLRAALENLVDNAVKFTERGSVRLDVSGSDAGHDRIRLIFTVADSGIGLKPAEIKRLFAPFAQASADVARRFGGSGLGLAFVKRLARAMGGDLKVSSRPGRGSTFILDVIVDRAAAGAETKPHLRASLRKRPVRSLRILCVEDNPYGRVVLNTILTELGHRTDFVGTGEAAVEAVARGNHDLVLLDVMLTGIDGIEAARRIRALPAPARNIAIIGVSGRGEADDAKAARAAGMDDYLIKPLNPTALAIALEKVGAHAKS